MMSPKNGEGHGRRSVSVDDMSSSWIMHRRSPPATPTGNSSINNDDDAESIIASRTSFDRDMELQAIIADALAKATAKTAAMDAARYSATYRQQEMERFQRHSIQFQNQSGSGSSSRCWTPSEDLVSSQCGSASVSRSESPFYPVITSTPSA
ncbi:hypothetical protein BGX31_001507 [Mortierella sp. GBA43]|nr:hypothetical protein BGX31_001507 [Mortierella sp. GBA43]